jgi:hypothetical protein
MKQPGVHKLLLQFNAQELNCFGAIQLLGSQAKNQQEECQQQVKTF